MSRSIDPASVWNVMISLCSYWSVSQTKTFQRNTCFKWKIILPKIKHFTVISTYIWSGIEPRSERSSVTFGIAASTTSHHHMQKHVPRIRSVPREAQLLQRDLHLVAQQVRHQSLQAVQRVRQAGVGGCTEQTWKPAHACQLFRTLAAGLFSVCAAET